MSLTPTASMYLATGLLCALWLAIYQIVKRVDTRRPFHIAAYHRDRRKARFYFLSVWAGLGAALLSFLCLGALSTVTFETTTVREWVLGITRGIGIWGLLIIGAVWSQVGQRASQPNADGLSLLPLPEKKTGSRE